MTWTLSCGFCVPLLAMHHRSVKAVVAPNAQHDLRADTATQFVVQWRHNVGHICTGKRTGRGGDPLASAVAGKQWYRD